MKIIILLLVAVPIAVAKCKKVGARKPNVTQPNGRGGFTIISFSGVPIVPHLLKNLQNQPRPNPRNSKDSPPGLPVPQATTNVAKAHQEDEDDSLEVTTQEPADVQRFHMDSGGLLRVRVNQAPSFPGKLPQRFVIYNANRISVEPKVTSVMNKGERVYVPFNEVHVRGLVKGNPVDKIFHSVKGKVEVLKEPNLRPGQPDPDD